MKILVIQLAKLNDVYQTIPALNALRRKFPESEIDVLVNSKYSDILQRTNSINRIHCLNSEEILENIASNENIDLRDSYIEIDEFCNEVAEGNYNKIVNLSFTTLSSYVLNRLESEGVEASGYSRFKDGSLRIYDETSSYIHSQVGTHGYNRFHMTDLHAGVAGVLLEMDDYNICSDLLSIEGFKEFSKSKKINIKQTEYALVHFKKVQLGMFSNSSSWADLLKSIPTSTQLVLIGLEASCEYKREVLSHLPLTQSNVIDMVGETSLEEIELLAKFSSVVICCDGALAHISSLVNTPCINLSLGEVNYYEAGPMSEDSMIIQDNNIKSIAVKVREYFNQEPISLPAIVRENSDEVRYRTYGENVDGDFSWGLVKAIYLGNKFPELDDHEIFLALLRFNQIIELGLEQIKKNDVNSPTVMSVLSRVDEMIGAISKICPQVSPIVNWFNTERSKIPPVSLELVMVETQEKFEQCSAILSNYIPKKELFEFDGLDLDLV